MLKFNEVHGILGDGIKKLIGNIPAARLETTEEIRLRTNKPLVMSDRKGEFFITPQGIATLKHENAYIVKQRDIAETLTLISDYSIYAFEEEIKKGFITIKGGHRVGICGKTVTEGGRVRTIKNVSSLNIRVSHEVKGAANGVMKYIINGDKILHTIIVSPPKCGKTTLLRDIVRQISNGVVSLNFKGVPVAVVDERSEIAGCYMGIPQNDVGIRTDVLDCCPKAEGMQMLLRSMSPFCVAVDEIGSRDDINAIEEMLNAGIKLICTVHGEGYMDLEQKPYLRELIEKRLFETIIVLCDSFKAGHVNGIYDKYLAKKNNTEK